ncbi:hypothetical protein [Chelativorans sp.]|uniref:hypothetical protein n=1 Tax=Chelativorans sp. TaxID=2203393 RepID=UPI0028116667|nr:hypothetical protein [Chelativorans sp.]
MTDRPILFSAPMVRALLDGRKTQTRRVIESTNIPHLRRDDDIVITRGSGLAARNYRFRRKYVAGDRLWVREAWRCNGWASDLATIFYRASEGDGYTAMCEQYPVAGKRPLRVTGTWHPGIHMPRWVSRLTLIVTDVRVQRLQEVSEQDAVAEGCPGRLGPNPDFPDEWDPSPVEQFRDLWDSLNAHRGLGWDANPWVAAIAFTVERRNIDEPAE